MSKGRNIPKCMDGLWKIRLLSALIVLLLAFAFCAACTGSENGGGPSATETPTATGNARGDDPGLAHAAPTQTLPRG